jgi:hypothetical protein
MRSIWLLRAVVTLLVLVLAGWVVHKTRWVEIEVDDPIRGAAAADKFYSLRQVLQSAGATLEVRKALEPLPPAGATLMLNSSSWTVFPERDARLKAWVEAGGHLVVQGMQMQYGDDGPLRWLPLSFRALRKPHAQAASAASAAASAGEEDDEDEDEDPAPARAQRRAAKEPHPEDEPPRAPRERWSGRGCTAWRETDATTAPAFETGRVYRSCASGGMIRAPGRAPTWLLATDKQTLALRVPLGRGTVTGVASWTPLGNRALLQADNALIATAILQAAPGRAVWLVNDEAREPFALWLWHEARTPLLLCAAAIALALWRLMVRFGPLQAPSPRARRSMGEQVRGTGEFIAASDMAALHAATRRAFDDAARGRVEGWGEHTDEDRVAALAAALAPAVVLDTRALLDALHPGPGSPPAQWRAAIRVLEQARRALLRAARPDIP